MIFPLWVFVLSFFLFSSGDFQPCFAADSSPSYTDRDLNPYRNPADGRSATVPAPSRHTAKKAADRDGKEKEAWCLAGTRHAKKIDLAKERVQSADALVAKRQEEADRKPSDAKARKRLAEAQKKQVKEQKKLAQEEAALSALENRAHRKGIPPGWLKCNFDY